MVMRRKKIRLLDVPEPRCTFSKIEIASSNLDSAIRLWFEEYPLPSVLVLAYAAYDIIHVLCKAKIGTDYGYFFINRFIEKEKRGELDNIVKYPYNAIKHAITEQDALSVNRDLAVSVIMIAIIELSQISELSFYQKMFFGYAIVKHPEWYQDSAENSYPVDRLYDDKSLFYESSQTVSLFLSIIEKIDINNMCKGLFQNDVF